MRRLVTPCAVLAVLGCVSGCGGRASERTAVVQQQRDLPQAQARPPAPAASGALAQIADGRAARRRLGYVNLERVGEVRPVVAPRSVIVRVLGERGAGRLPPSGARTAVAVGGATVVRGSGVRDLARDGGALPSGADGIVVGGDLALRSSLSRTRPTISAITPVAQSAVQSCLGDALAQTILGPGTMGRDGAIGAGLRISGDRPAGVQLAICAAPHLRRDLRAARRRSERRFESLDVPRARRPVIAELEIGEREMLSVVVPADGLSRRELLAFLSGGDALRAIGGRG